MSDEDIRVLVHQAVAAIEANSRFLREVARRLDDDSDLPQGGHTHHEHPMYRPLERPWPGESVGGHAHFPGVPCSWCPPDIQDASGVAAAFVHPVEEVDEETQRIYDEAQQHDPWPGESYEGTTLREFPDLEAPPIEEVNRVNPYGEWDAETWAKAFVEEHGGDVGLMLAWFANALMTGYDEGRRRERQLQEGGDDAQ